MCLLVGYGVDAAEMATGGLYRFFQESQQRMSYLLERLQIKSMQAMLHVSSFKLLGYFFSF